MKKILLTILLLPLVSLAQSGELVVGEKTVGYDKTVDVEASTLYYQGETLVASEHDGKALVYENDQVVLEAHDTDGDGKLDAFLALDRNEEVMSVTGEGASEFERPETVEFADLVAEGGGSEAAASDDLVGSLDSIKIPGGGLPLGTIIIWLAIIGGGYWFYKKRKEKTDEPSSQ